MFFMDGTQKRWNCPGKLLHNQPLLFLYLWDKKKLVNKIWEWDGVLTQCKHSLKIAIIIYRCIKNSAGMMLTNEIEHDMQQWNYIKPKQKH